MIPFKAAKNQADAYEQRMEDLSMRIAQVLDGETLVDCASACAGAIAFATKELSPESRERVLVIFSQFIRKCWEDND